MAKQNAENALRREGPLRRNLNACGIPVRFSNAPNKIHITIARARTILQHVHRRANNSFTSASDAST